MARVCLDSEPVFNHGDAENICVYQFLPEPIIVLI